MKTILVTGAAGFIGTNFVLRQLAQPDVRVISLDKLTYAGNRDNLAGVMEHPQHAFVQGDIGDRRLMPELLAAHRPEVVVNFAAESHVDRSIDGPVAFVDTNIVGTFNLLESLRDYARSGPGRDDGFRFVQVSTDEVYGSLGSTGYFSETSCYAPNSPYAASKAAADHLVRAYGKTYQLPVVTTNCSNNYGPYQFPEKLIPLMIIRALAGEPLPVYGQGSQVRDWLYVGDHCRAIERVVDDGRPGEVYTIGGSSEQSNLQLVERLCQLLDERLPDSPYRPHAQLIDFVEDRPGHDSRYAIDARKISDELGWAPEEDLDSGLARTLDWYLDNRRWWERIMERGYKARRQGLSA